MAYLDFIDPGNSGGSVPVTDSPFDGIGFREIVYPCSICGQHFNSHDALFEHRFQTHPFKRPTLLLAGVEITSPRQLVVSPLQNERIVFGHTSTCYLNNHLIDAEALKTILSSKASGICTIRLENGGVESFYQLDFDIPENSDIVGVEQVFFEVVGGNALDIPRIDLFIDMASKFITAKRYIDGLSSYLYGVLAKDQRGGIQLGLTDSVVKLNQALDTLKVIERPLAQAVVGLVNLNQNVFIDEASLGAAPKAQGAMRRFHEFITGIASGAPERFENLGFGRKIPLDFATEKIIEWTLMSFDDLSSVRKELEHVLKSPNWVANDKFKVQLLLAELLVFLGDYSPAIRIAGGLSNDIIFCDWARRIIERKGEN